MRVIDTHSHNSQHHEMCHVILHSDLNSLALVSDCASEHSSSNIELLLIFIRNNERRLNIPTCVSRVWFANKGK